MSWPTSSEFQAALKHPLGHFCKPELKRGQAAHDEQGLPRALTGSHMDVYELRGAGGVDRWAIGCFTKPPHGLARRYFLINEHLRNAKGIPLVEQEFIEQGICVRGRWHPITRSRWIEGKPLNEYVRQYLEHPDELRLLASAWVHATSAMRSAGIAHGNLRPENVIVGPGHGGSLVLKLVDYDGIYVPALKEPFSDRVGHADFLHPRCTEIRPFNVDMDRFGQLVVLTALYAIAVEGQAIWDRFDTGDNLLFKQSDFQKPQNSPLFAALWHSESSTVRALAGLLILAAQGPIDEVPSLETVTQFLRPGAARIALKQWQIDQINKLIESGVRVDFNMSLDEKPSDAAASEPEESKPIVAPVAADGDMLNHGIREGASAPPPPPPTPPPLPSVAAQIHPNTQTYQLEAWMPEEVALVKLHGFVKDAGGRLVSNVPGYIKVHLIDERDLVRRPQTPGLMALLGLAEKPPPAPRVRAVMELNLVHKSTETRKRVGITMRLAPGPDDEVTPRWRGYCDKMYCNLRGYLIGAGD